MYNQSNNWLKIEKKMSVFNQTESILVYIYISYSSFLKNVFFDDRVGTIFTVLNQSLLLITMT